MKKTFTAALIALTATSAFAFGGGKESKMMRGLDLTDEQKVQIQEMREAHRAALEPLRQQHMQDIRALLTPEQQAKFDERMAKWAAKMEKRRAKRES